MICMHRDRKTGIGIQHIGIEIKGHRDRNLGNRESRRNIVANGRALGKDGMDIGWECDGDGMGMGWKWEGKGLGWAWDPQKLGTSF